MLITHKGAKNQAPQTMKLRKKDESYYLLVQDKSHGVIRSLFQCLRMDTLLKKSNISMYLDKDRDPLTRPGEFLIGKMSISVALQKKRKNNDNQRV